MERSDKHFPLTFDLELTLADDFVTSRAGSAIA